MPCCPLGVSEEIGPPQCHQTRQSGGIEPLVPCLQRGLVRGQGLHSRGTCPHYSPSTLGAPPSHAPLSCPIASLLSLIPLFLLGPQWSHLIPSGMPWLPLVPLPPWSSFDPQGLPESGKDTPSGFSTSLEHFQGCGVPGCPAHFAQCCFHPKLWDVSPSVALSALPGYQVFPGFHILAV